MVEGFRRMYRFLLDHRDALLGAEPLRELAREQVRFVFRATSVYWLILHNLRHRRYLRDGADRSIGLEQLGRAQVPPREAVDEPDEKPLFWPVFRAERLAMEEGDIPFFTARASSDALILSPGREIDACFQEPSFDLVLRVLRELDDEDLEQQVAIDRGLYVRPPGPREHDLAPRPGRAARRTIRPDRRQKKRSSPRRSSWRNRSGRARSVPRTVARPGSRRSSWSRRSASNCSPSTTTSTAGRAASRCFSRPPSGSPLGPGTASWRWPPSARCKACWTAVRIVSPG